LVLAALLLGAALRFYRLDAQSLWNDEGNTARLVERSVRLIVEGAAGDIHPPGYYLILAVWRSATGDSEFALRGFSALCGVLTIAVAAALGQRAGGWATAVGAAFLVAVHPLAVYYSQEARMYALLGLVSALTLLVAERFVRTLSCGGVNYVSSQYLGAAPGRLQVGRPACLRFPDRARLGCGQETGHSYLRPTGRRPHLSRMPKTQPVPDHQSPVYFHGTYLGLALCIAFGLYTQYAYAFVLLGMNLAFAGVWLTRRPWRWRTLVPWVTAQLLGGLAFLPWLPHALKVTRWQPPDLNSGTALVEMAHALLTGITLPLEGTRYLFPVAGLLLALALARPARSRFVAWSCVAVTLLPLLLIAALGVYRPAYLKFLLIAVAPLAVVCALPLSRSPRLLRLLAGVLLLALLPAQVASLRNLYCDPAYVRDDYRGIAARIAAEASPEDGILLNAPNQWEVFTYYYHGPLTVYPAIYHPTPEEATAWLDEVLQAGHPQLFVLYWGDGESDPHHYFEQGLAQRAYKVGDVWIGSARLARYGTGPLPQAPTMRVAALLGERIILEGVNLPRRDFAPGEIVPLTLFWRAAESPDERLKVFVHLLDGSGTLAAQNDAEPVGNFRPTDGWQPGEQLADRYGVLLPRDLPPGDYALWVGMYRFSGERLPVTQAGQPAGDAVNLGVLTVRQ